MTDWLVKKRLKGDHLPKTITAFLIVVVFVLTGITGFSREQRASKLEKVTLALRHRPAPPISAFT